MILTQLLDRPGDGFLLVIEAGIEIEAVFLLYMEPYERGIRNGFPVIDNDRQLSLGRLADIGANRFLFQSGELQQHMALGDEGAAIGKAEIGAIDLQLNH